MIAFIDDHRGSHGVEPICRVLPIAIQVMVNWVATIFGVTLLTSLYGYFVEGRDF
jgi:hypothetical protein